MRCSWWRWVDETPGGRWPRGENSNCAHTTVSHCSLLPLTPLCALTPLPGVPAQTASFAWTTSRTRSSRRHSRRPTPRRRRRTHGSRVTIRLLRAEERSSDGCCSWTATLPRSTNGRPPALWRTTTPTHLTRQAAAPPPRTTQTGSNVPVGGWWTFIASGPCPGCCRSIRSGASRARTRTHAAARTNPAR